MALIPSQSTDGVHEVVFNDAPTAKQRYKLDGVAVPGVTTFIKAGMPTPEGLQIWKIGKGAEFAYDNSNQHRESVIAGAKTAWKTDAEEAAGIGVIVHEYAELVSHKRHEEALEMLAKHEGNEHWGGILAAVHKVDEFNEANKDEIIATEQIVASTMYQYAGRFDRLVRRDGKVGITDYKTSKGFYIEQFIQDAMYSIAIQQWMGIEVDFYEVVLFGKEGGEFKPLTIDSTPDKLSLQTQGLNCLNTYNFLKIWNKDERFKYKKATL